MKGICLFYAIVGSDLSRFSWLINVSERHCLIQIAIIIFKINWNVPEKFDIYSYRFFLESLINISTFL